MIEPRPKNEQHNEKKDQHSPNVVLEPSTNAVPAKQNVTNLQPKSPDSSRRPSQQQVANPKDPARASTQSKP
jgi:hypothetical protein